MFFFDGGILPHQRSGGLGHYLNQRAGLGADYNKRIIVILYIPMD